MANLCLRIAFALLILTITFEAIADGTSPPVPAEVISDQVAAGDACTDSDTLCVGSDRFIVEVEWQDFDGNTGSGQVVPFRSDTSGLFWFFDADNWEMLVKVLDGCELNGHFWVFSAATTNVEYTLWVTDTETNTVREYFNPLGHAADAITDTSAFPTCPVPPSLKIEDVHYSINGRGQVLAELEQIVKLEEGDIFAITQATFSSPQSGNRNDVANMLGVLRTDPSQPNAFPESTFLGSDPNAREFVTAGVHNLGGILYDADRNRTDGWTMEPGTDRMALALIHNYRFDSSTGCDGGQGDARNGCFEVDDRFFLNLQVGQPDFSINDCSLRLVQSDAIIDPDNPTTRLALGEEVQVSTNISNQGDGRYFIDAECDIFPIGDGRPVWVGVASFLIDEDERIEIEIANTNPDDEFPVRWRPESPGTYVVTVTVDPEDAKDETDHDGGESNNFAIIGVETEPLTDAMPSVTDFNELTRELELFESELEIRNSAPVLPLCNNERVAFDGLLRSFASRGIAPSSCSPEFDPSFGAFRALIAFGRVFAFDVATEVLEDVVTEDYDSAKKKLEVLEELLNNCEEVIGAEVVVDSWNTVGDAFPFNVEEEVVFRRGTAGNVASILQAFFAYQFASGDDGFEESAIKYLNTLLDGRRITDAKSPAAVGLIASRPSGGGNGFAIVENNLRVLDMLNLAVRVTDDFREERDDLESALRQALAVGEPGNLPEAVARDTGIVLNHFTAQDIYTIGGIFMLRQGLHERAWEFIEFVEDNFVVTHTPESETGRNLGPGAVPPMDEEIVGLKFFDGCDAENEENPYCSTGCSLLTSDVGQCESPINFDDPTVISIQTEATLDYILFLDEFVNVVVDSEKTEFAAARRDQLMDEVVELFNRHSQKGGLPVSTRSILNLFETFDGSLPSAEARIIERVMNDRSRLFFYRGVPAPD